MLELRARVRRAIPTSSRCGARLDARAPRAPRPRAGRRTSPRRGPSRCARASRPSRSTLGLMRTPTRARRPSRPRPRLDARDLLDALDLDARRCRGPARDGAVELVVALRDAAVDDALRRRRRTPSATQQLGAAHDVGAAPLARQRRARRRLPCSPSPRTRRGAASPRTPRRASRASLGHAVEVVDVRRRAVRASRATSCEEARPPRRQALRDGVTA